MLPRHHPGRVQITFDGHRLAANAGLILPATLARALGLPQRLGLRCARANYRRPDDDAGGLRLAGSAASACAAIRRTGPGQGALHLGTFLRRFRWGHVRQLDRVSRELARASGGWGLDPAAHHSPSADSADASPPH